MDSDEITVLPNPANDLVAIQFSGLLKENVKLQLLDLNGRIVRTTIAYAGQTIAWFNIEDLYDGLYIVQLQQAGSLINRKVQIKH